MLTQMLLVMRNRLAALPQNKFYINKVTKLDKNKNLKIIYSLLRERKFTIDGAKEFLKKSKNADKKHEMITQLKNLKSFLD